MILGRGITDAVDRAVLGRIGALGGDGAAAAVEGGIARDMLEQGAPAVHALAGYGRERAGLADIQTGALDLRIGLPGKARRSQLRARRFGRSAGEPREP